MLIGVSRAVAVREQIQKDYQWLTKTIGEAPEALKEPLKELAEKCKETLQTMDTELNKNIITLPEEAKIYLDELKEEEKEPEVKPGEEIIIKR